MENFYDTQVAALEASHCTDIESLVSPLVNIKDCDGSRINIMLNSGLIIDPDKNHFNNTLLSSYLASMPDSSVKPNQRLLNQFSDYLTKIGFDHDRETLHIKPGKQRVLIWTHCIDSWLTPCRIMLSSYPVAGKSYLNVTVFGNSSDWDIKHSFIAQSPITIYQRLVLHKLLPDKFL